MMQPEYKTHINKTDAMNSDIINAIHHNFTRSVNDVKEFAKRFDYGNAESSAKAVWLFLRKYITYRRDPDHSQMIKLPARFIADKTGDCKSFSLFAASILGSLGYRVAFRYAGYKPGSNTPTHVYVYLPDENIIIDGCYKFFNKEKTPEYFQDYDMDVYTLSGIGDRESRRRRRQERREERREERKENKTSVAKKVTLAPARNAFYILLRNNVFGYGTKMKLAIQKNESAVKSKWIQLGGDWDKLKELTNLGASKRAIIGGKKTKEAAKQLNGLDRVTRRGKHTTVYYSRISGIGVEPATTATAGTFATIAAAAAPVLIALAAMLKALGVGDGDPNNPNDISVSEVLELAGEAGGRMFDPTTGEYQITDKGTGIDHMSTDTLLLIGGAVLAALLLFSKK